MGALIRASGGLVFRTSGSRHQILVVHRPRYDDWSLPKGKDDPGETPQAAARREVLEETGVTAHIVSDLGEVRYHTPQENSKQVRYFAMRAVEVPEFTPNEEVDETRWVNREAAAGLLTYPFDRELVAKADLAVLARSGYLFLVRHANAGERSRWDGPDHLRTLSNKGCKQAETLAGMLGEWGIDRIMSSPSLRCVETVAPLADRLDLEVEDCPRLGEGRGTSVLELLARFVGHNVVLSSHGDVIPAILDRLAREGVTLTSPTGLFECKKASVWRVTVSDGETRSADYIPPPEV